MKIITAVLVIMMAATVGANAHSVRVNTRTNRTARSATYRTNNVEVRSAAPRITERDRVKENAREYAESMWERESTIERYVTSEIEAYDWIQENAEEDKLQDVQRRYGGDSWHTMKLMYEWFYPAG